MKYIKTPYGDIFEYDECEIIETDENQKELANKLFEKTGILIANKKGGENNE